MNYYQKSIIKILECSPEDAKQVEDLMRHEIFHSTLDWVSAKQFKRGAKQAFAVLKFSRTEEGKAFAKQVEEEMTRPLNRNK